MVYRCPRGDPSFLAESAMHARAMPLFLLALAGLAHAAPARFARRAAPEHPPVLLTGWLEEVRLTGQPSVINCQTDYLAAARVLGIDDPPRVNFRTHFLFINLSIGYPQVISVLDADGDL